MTLDIEFDTFLHCVSAMHLLKERLRPPFDEFANRALADLRAAMIASIKRGEVENISPEFDRALNLGILEMTTGRMQ